MIRIFIIARESRPPSVTFVIVTILFAFVVFMPISQDLCVETLKTYGWHEECVDFDWTVVLVGNPDTDYGSTATFNPSSEPEIWTLFQRVQGLYEVMSENGSTIASFDFRSDTCTFQNYSVSLPMEDEPIQFPTLGLSSVFEWTENCYGMAAKLGDATGNIVVKTGIRLSGKSDSNEVCLKESVGYYARAAVLGMLMIKRIKLGRGCRGLW